MSDSGISSASKAKRFLWDLSGAFGDIGVLFPIAVALIARNGFNPAALFLMAGLFYICSAYYFRITMPVQPLKAMSAIAISAGLGVEVITAAGLAMGVILTIIAASGLGIRLGAIFPVSVIRGIQLGLGIMLVRTSIGLMQAELLIAFVAGFILALSILVFKKVPTLIPLVAFGIVLSLRDAAGYSGSEPLALKLSMPSLENIWMGLSLLVAPQLALTFGNAIVATENTGRLLYGERASRLNLRSIPLSMGIANLLSGVVGGAPMCHGSGGLTAHKTFGATSERSGYIIGMTLIGMAVLFGNSAIAFIAAFPSGILGALLCYVGLQHAFFIKDILSNRADLSVAAFVGILGVLTNNLSLGFAGGLAVYHGMKGIRRATAYYAS